MYYFIWIKLYHSGVIKITIITILQNFITCQTCSIFTNSTLYKLKTTEQCIIQAFVDTDGYLRNIN